MKYKIYLSLLLAGALAACASGQKIGHTQVVIKPKVKAWSNLSAGLLALRECTTEAYGKFISDKVFDVTIEVYPKDHELDWLGTTMPNMAGSYNPYSNRIEIRMRESDMFVSALPHELFQHRLPWVLNRNINTNHAPELMVYEVNAVACAMTKLSKK